MPALAADGTQRDNGQVVEITDQLDLSGWPAGSRVIVRRERPHPGAQLSFTDHDGHRFQAILTDQTGELADLERLHRARARVEDRIRAAKDTGLTNLPLRDFALNEAWLELVLIAQTLERRQFGLWNHAFRHHPLVPIPAAPIRMAPRRIS